MLLSGMSGDKSVKALLLVFLMIYCIEMESTNVRKLEFSDGESLRQFISLYDTRLVRYCIRCPCVVVVLHGGQSAN